MNTLHAYAAALAIIGGMLAGTAGTLLVSPAAHAEPLPTCLMEDGSDVPADQLPCVWVNDGKSWLTYADHSELI